MSGFLTIGDFASATHLNVKALRYYHRVGVLTPADIDPTTGYRRYRTDQIVSWRHLGCLEQYPLSTTSKRDR